MSDAAAVTWIVIVVIMAIGALIGSVQSPLNGGRK